MSFEHLIFTILNHTIRDILCVMSRIFSFSSVISCNAILIPQLVRYGRTVAVLNTWLTL